MGERFALRAKARCPANHSAGNFCAGIAGWLSRKIIGMVVDDDGLANHLADGKAGGEKRAQRKSPIAKQRRQVSRVVGVFAASRIVMRQSVCKRTVQIAAAVGSLMDMESKDFLLKGRIALGEAADLRADNYAAIGLVKPYNAG